MKNSGVWFVYILRCKNKSLYTGITTDLKRRFEEHRNKGARYTSYNPPVRFVHTEQFATRSEALKRESQIKSWDRSKKLALIRGALR